MSQPTRPHPRKVRLAVEALETRCVPAGLFVSFNGNTLTIGDGSNQNGTPSDDGGGTPALTITINGDGTVDAGDGTQTANLANDTPAGSIAIRLGNFASRTVINTSAALPLPGSINYLAGNGGNTVTVNNNGRIAGDLNIRSGNGADLVTLNDADVGGSLLVHTAFGNDTLIFTGSSSVDGNLYPTGVNNLTIPAGTTVSGLVNFSNFNEALPATITIAGTVRGGAFLNTSLFAGDLIQISGDIFGDLIINAGNGDNDIFLTGNVGGRTVVTTGFGVDEVTASGQFSDNVSFILGDGVNALNVTGNIGGSLVSVITGNGADNVVFAANAGGATLNAYLGAGNDTFTYNPGAVLARDFLNGGFGVNIFQAKTATLWPSTRFNFEGQVNSVQRRRANALARRRRLRLLRLRRLRLLAALQAP